MVFKGTVKHTFFGLSLITNFPVNRTNNDT